MSDWPRPSERVAELIRAGLLRQIEHAEAVFAELDEAVLASADAALLADPALAEGIRRNTRNNLARWMEANLAEPGVRVTPVIGPDAVATARDIVRRGLDATSVETFRTGQNLAWRRWMETVFELTSDPDELRELLDVTARSIFTYVDETVAAVAAEVERERERLSRGTHAQRFEVVSLILDGSPIAPTLASTRLNYELEREHTAAIVFGDPVSTDQGALEQAAEALARAAGARRPLTVIATTASLWVWVPGVIDVGGVRGVDEARVALGTPGRGIEGFRRSHLDAVAVQRLMYRSPEDVRLAAFEDVQVAAFATADEDRAHDLAERTLGELAHAPADLRETLRVYLREGSSATATARVLFTHRNTVLNRLARAEALLPRALAGRGLQVGLALEIVRWIGTR